MCRDLPTGLGEALDHWGMLSCEEGRQLLLDMSSSLVDNLPKAGEKGHVIADAACFPVVE